MSLARTLSIFLSKYVVIDLGRGGGGRVMVVWWGFEKSSRGYGELVVSE